MLKIELHEKRDLWWWYERYRLDKVDMNPPYQRRAEIWSKWKRGHLMDSILNDFDIPKFYVANFNVGSTEVLNTAHKQFAIIDGKQRLGAIFAFFEDAINLNPSCRLDERPDVRLGGFNFSRLKSEYPHLAAKIERFEPTVMNVITDDQDRIQELFVRLNMGEAATGAERRNAMGGPVPAAIRELAMHPFFLRRIKFKTIRMEEYNLIAKLLLLEFKGSFTDTKKNDLDRFALDAIDWLHGFPDNDTVSGPYAEARDRVLSNLELLNEEFVDGDKLLASAGSIPIYYWFARENREKVDELHDFITDFNVDLKHAREAEKAGNRPDVKLLQYYTMGRTTNDQGSLMGRYAIFEEAFNRWHAKRSRRKR
jgi:Protein of unknown function DUF262